MSLFSKENGFLGVDIGAYGIKIVQLNKTKGRPQLWTYGIVDGAIDIHLPDFSDKSPEQLSQEGKMLGSSTFQTNGEKKDTPLIYGESDPRVDRYAEILMRLMKEARVTTTLATASIPVSHVFHTIVTLPKVEKESDIQTYINAELKKVLTRPLEEMQVVHQKIPSTNKDEKYMRVLVTAAPKTLVAFYSAIFQKAGLQLRELETEAFAIERSLVGKETATMMVVDVGAERTNFFIMDKGLPMTHRSIQVGGDNIDTVLSNILGVDPTLVDVMKGDVGMISWDEKTLSVFDVVLDPILKEVQYSFDLFLSQSGNEGKRPEKIVLTGGSSVFPPLKKRLEQTFDMRVFVGDPWAPIVYQQELKPLLSELGPRMSVSIGLALRNIIE